jgi:hypothetical protein
MLAGQSHSNSVMPYRIIGVLAILALGGYKFAAAIYHGRTNLSFLIVLAIAGVVIALIAGRLPRVTKLGNAYLERLKLAFGPAGGHPAVAAPNSRGAAGVDPLLLAVGVFGTAALAGTAYSYYNDAFRKSENAAGCGSGCGTCSSSSCSSGDSGSSCGGGCGGCGGGD